MSPATNMMREGNKKGIKECLKLLESDELRTDDIEGLGEELKLKPELGDRMQFELHKYCMRNCSEKNPELVIKLAKLCYSNISVSQFSNIIRFIGCVYHISDFLLKKERYNSAIEVTSSLLLKKNEILDSSKEKKDIRTFLFNLYNRFIATASLVGCKVNNVTDDLYQISRELAMESLNILSLIGGEQEDVGKKMLKTTFSYLQTIKHYKERDVLQFHKTQRGILKILLPQIADMEYFLVFIFKIAQLKKSDSDVDIHQTLGQAVHLLTTFLNSSSEVRKMLCKVLEFFSSDFQLNRWINEEELQGLISSGPHSVCHFLLFSSIFSYGVEFLWTKFKDSWCENVSTSLVEKLSVAILTLHKSYSRSQILYCHSVKGSLGTCFGDLLMGNLQKIQYTVRLCLKNKIPDALSLVPISQEAFKLSMQCVRHMKSMGCSDDHTTYSWKISVIHCINMVEDIFRLATLDEGWSYMKDSSREVLREVVNSNVELPFDFSRLKVLFQRWHTSCLRLKNHQEAFYACLVYYVFRPEEEREIMSMWLETKSESSDKTFEGMTMPDMFKTCEKNLKAFIKTYDHSNVSVKSALLLELKAYSTCSPDTFKNPNATYKLATKIWNLLKKFKLDPWESSLAMSSLITTCIAGEGENLPDGFYEKCQKHIEELINNQQEKVQRRNLLHAANLTFSLFLYKMKMVERSEGEADTTHMVLGYLKKAEQEKVKLGEDVDVNLKCDVIPTSKHLTVELETNYLNELNKIVELWSAALKSETEDLPSSAELDLWLQDVKQVAHMYELFGEYQRAFTTWLMFYRVGKLQENSGAMLLGLTRLIENCADVDDSRIKQEAELMTEKLGSEAKEKYVLVEYSLAIASNHLKNKKASKCLESLTRAKKILEGLRNTITTHTLNAKFWCLVSQFLVVYREHAAAFDYAAGTDVRVMALKAFSYSNGGGRGELIRSASQSECMELVLTMLEVNLWAYHLHGVYRQTDLMRFFLDDLYQVVQKLFLPSRTAEILLRLAEVDMICEKSADCQEKVFKLKSILTTLSQSCSREVVKSEGATSPYLTVPQSGDLEGLRPISPARFLECCPQTNKELDVSPVHFYLADPKSSKTKEHVRKCKCRLCENLLIQILTFNTIWLEAEMHNLERNLKEATRCYSKAYEVLNRVEKLRDEQSEILRLTSASVFSPSSCRELDFRLAFAQFHCARFLIKYAFFESSSLKSVTENVQNTVLRIKKLMKKFSHEEKLLMWTFAELKLFLVVLHKGVEKPCRSSPAAFKTTAIARTPLVTSKIPPIVKSSGKFVKSPHPCGQPKRILFEEEPSLNSLNTAFVDEDDARPSKVNFLTTEDDGKKFPKDRTICTSRKLDFDISPDPFEEKGAKEVPVASQTRRERQGRKEDNSKTAKDKTTKFQTRKLDPNFSADLFEEEIKEETPVASQARRVRQDRKAATAPVTARRESKQKPVKIYLDSKDDAKSKKTVTEKAKSKTRKN